MNVRTVLVLTVITWLIVGRAMNETARSEPPGLWLLPRKDLGNTGRADVPGNMPAAPAEVWRYGGAAGAYRFARQVTVGGELGYVVQKGRGLARLKLNGSVVWEHPRLGVDAVIGLMDFTGQDKTQVLVSLGKVGFALLDAASGETLWKWRTPEGAMAVRCQLLKQPQGVRLFVFPPSVTAAAGFCFDFAGTDGEPRLLWERDYADRWWANYGPNLVLADMDADGQQEVVVASKPAYIGVLDGDTGDVKFEVRYEIEDPYAFGRPDEAQIGRPYGLMHAADVDDDGYPDIVLAPTQVEEYVAVLRNEGGKGLKPMWTVFVEKDFPEDRRQLVAQPTSLADIDEDGQLELVLGIYNLEGDERWRTLVLDTFAGLDAPLADLKDKFFWGCFDVDGDAEPEIITSPLASRWPTEADTLEVLDGSTGSAIAILQKARPTTVYSTIARMFRPRRPDLTFYGALVEPWYLAGKGPGSGLVVKLGAQQDREQLWRVEGGASVLEPFAPTAFARAMILTSDEGQGAAVDWQTAPRGPAGGAQSVGARSPRVGVAGGQRELVLSLSDGTVIGGTPDFAHSGRFSRSWRVRGATPALWIGPDGERIVCVANPETGVVTIHQPVAGQRETTPLRTFQLPFPLNTNPMMRGVFPQSEGSMLPFGEKQMWLFVPLRLGEHQLGCCLFDPAGQLLWTDREVGPHPRLAAVVDLDENGRPELVVDNHGMQYHYADLTSERRMVAHVWGNTIPGRGDGCAHALPVVGPFGPNRALRVVMTPGYTALEVQGPDGERVAQRPFAHPYEFAGRTAGIGNVRGAGQWDLGIVSDRGVFHCIDVATGDDRWTLPLIDPTSWPISVASGDLDGNRRDEFLVGLPDGRLVALTERDGRGMVLWQVTYEVGVLDAIIADVDGDQLAEIIAETEDGYVRVLRGPNH